MALDTASRLTSIALARGGCVLAELAMDSPGKGAERLWAHIEFLLREIGAGIKDVDAFAVCVGPGGFTGIRIGIAAVQGFVRASGKPAVGITSLEAMAMAASPAPRVCVLLEAYRGEVYSQTFKLEPGSIPIGENEPFAGPLDDAIKRTLHHHKMVFAGEAATQNLELINDLSSAGADTGLDSHVKGGMASVARQWQISPRIFGVARYVAEIGLLRFQSGKVGGPDSLKACYARRAEAEIKLSLGLVGRGLGREPRPSRE